MYFTSAVLSTAILLIAGRAVAGSAYHHVDTTDDIAVELTNTAGQVSTLRGFSTGGSVVAKPNAYAGAISQVRVSFSDSAKQAYPQLEPDFRCALHRISNGSSKRVVVTRGSTTDFNFGHGGNPNAWNLKGGPLQATDLTVTCDPVLRKTDPGRTNEIRVLLSNDAQESSRQLDFSASKGLVNLSVPTGGEFLQVELIVGPGVENQSLRCQAVSNGQVVRLNRGANLNKETFGDGGNGAWTIASGMATSIDKITCSPNFV
ncbi:hypothetical protein Micbo1qcDRAFT_210184 [Microdochium bolleyi]|uniref:Uncharacterized protein n=1 Tax=Microdochium bolleyi TaxID=196109 RepID=A0A136IJP1_9PEZI|nr:hypothetical protein Micbo1qcDRAFT_210184 [Microdochium bolleyi]